MDEMPVIPVYFYTVMRAASGIKGWYPTILDLHPYKFMYLETNQ